MTAPRRMAATPPTDTGADERLGQALPPPMAQAWQAARAQLPLLAAASLCLHLLLLAPSLYMLQVYDRALPFRQDLTLLLSSLALLLALAGVAVLESWRARRLLVLQQHLAGCLAAPVQQASLQASLRGQEQAATEGPAALASLRQALAGPTLATWLDAPWVPVYLLALAFMHPVLGGVALAFGGLQAWQARGARQALRAPTQAAAAAWQHELQEARRAEQQADAHEALGMAPRLLQRWLAARQAQRQAGAQAHAAGLRVEGHSQMLRHVQQSLSLGVGAWLVLRGEMSVGAMIAANLLMNRALSPIDHWVGSAAQALAARSAWRRLAGVLAEPAPPGLALPNPLRGVLSLQGVSASVAGRAQPLLQGLTLQLLPGQVVGVLGPSGAGKSVLGRVLLGLWPEVQGQCLLDGVPLAALDRAALGPQLGYLPQDVQLLDGTVAENIARFGPLDAAAVLAAAQACGLHDFILRLPQGYDTPVGPGGQRLSGGLRQRVGLARAVYGRPRLLVLDEPNAHLDDGGERALAQLLRQQAQGGATVLVTTHRPAVLGAVDRVLVLADGRLRDDGPPEAVLARLRRAAAPLATPAAAPLAAPALS